MEEADLEPALRALASGAGNARVPPLAPGEARAWISDGPLPAGLREAACRFLTPWDEALFASVSNLRAREERRDARALLRSLLALHLGGETAALPFREGEHGKPHLDGGPAGFDFSVSHSAGTCAVALASGTPIGVDVEIPKAIAGRVERLAPRVLDPASLAAFESIPEGDARAREDFFYRQWVIREAVLKATGCGLTIDPRTLSLRAASAPEGDLACEVPGFGTWSARFEPAPCRVAVARREGVPLGLFTTRAASFPR